MKKGLGITKWMCYGASVCLIILMIGFVLAPISTHRMNNTQNYCFSDMLELQIFEQKLNDEEIPFSRLSDTTINISKAYAKEADNIYRAFEDTLGKGDF